MSITPVGGLFVGVGEVIVANNWLSAFWHAICHSGVTVDPSDGDVLLFGRERLVIRQCYLALRGLITEVGDGSHFLVLGKAGVGKSTFVNWFIYQLWEGGVDVPSIVFVDRDNDKYWLASTGAVLIYNPNVHPKPDYYFSDSHDVKDKNLATILCLVVSSENESETGYKEFSKRIMEVAKGRTRYIPSMSPDELTQAFPNLTPETRQFRYDVVGGNPRHFQGAGNDAGSDTMVELVRNEVGSFFGLEYIGPVNGEVNVLMEELGTWATNTISLAFSKSGDGLKQACSSLCQQFEVDDYCTRRGNLPASTFIGMLLEHIRTEGNQDIIDVLQSIIGSSGVGFGFEYAAHRNILNSHHPYCCVELKSGLVRTNTVTTMMAIQNKRKVLIRTVGDIATLTEYDYGLPTIPNFPLVDAVILPNICLQMTTSRKHLGAVDKLTEIAASLHVNVDELVMIFVVPEDTIANFKYVDELLEFDKQYVTLSSPASPAAVVKARKGKRALAEEDDEHHGGGEEMAGRGHRGRGRGRRGRWRGRF